MINPKCFCHLRAAWFLFDGSRSIYYGSLIIYGKRSTTYAFLFLHSLIYWLKFNAFNRAIAPSIPVPRPLPTHFILFPLMVFLQYPHFPVIVVT